MITLNTTLIPILKENGIGFRYIGGIYDPMTIIITHKSIDICRVDMNCSSCEPYNYNVYWFASVVKNASDLRKQYLMSQTLIDDINKAIYFERGENKMDECNFSLSTNLIPALNAERIYYRTIYPSICNAKSLVVMYTYIDICRVEVIQDIRSSYCYKVNWEHDRDIICFPAMYDAYTALIADIKKAINRLKNEGENKMDKQMYKVTDIEFKSSPSQMDEMTVRVNVLGSHCCTREDCDRIKEAIERINNTKESCYIMCGRGNNKTHTLRDMMIREIISLSFDIKDVIFNNPATIIFWKDGTKTVVKAENEEFDPEKGLAMAIAKKTLGNCYGYYDVFKKYVGRYEKKQKKGDK